MKNKLYNWKLSILEFWAIRVCGLAFIVSCRETEDENQLFLANNVDRDKCPHDISISLNGENTCLFCGRVYKEL